MRLPIGCSLVHVGNVGCRQGVPAGLRQSMRSRASSLQVACQPGQRMRVEAGQRMGGGIGQHVGRGRGQRVRGERGAGSPRRAGARARRAASLSLLLALHVGVQVALCIQAARAVELLVPLLLGRRRPLLLLLPRRRGGAAPFPLCSCQVILLLVIHAIQQLTCPARTSVKRQQSGLLPPLLRLHASDHHPPAAARTAHPTELAAARQVLNDWCFCLVGPLGSHLSGTILRHTLPRTWPAARACCSAACAPP